LQKNITKDGPFLVKSGVNDIRMLGRLVEWKGQPNLTMWAGGICNNIDGTDSTIFRPFWSPKEKIAIFLTDMCRYAVIGHPVGFLATCKM
jgi:hypothetical protein